MSASDAPEFANPSTAAIADLLRRVRTIAVVGLSPRADRPSHRVAAGLQAAGYRIIPVRPAVDEVLGERAWPRLEDIPAEARRAIDLVDVFRAPQYVDALVDSCLALELPALWLQDGVVNPAAARRAQQAGMVVVMDRCTWRDYRQLVAGEPPR